MKETELYQPIVAGLLQAGHAVYKINDGSMGKKPFDIGGCTVDGLAVGIEIKIAASSTEEAKTRLNWRPFEEHQVNWLHALARRGGIAIATIYYVDISRLYVWRLQSGQDGCNREPDLILRRHDGIFTDWADLFQKAHP